MRAKTQEGIDEFERQEAQAAAAGQRGGCMKEPSVQKGAGSARHHNDGAGAFLPLYLLSALVFQVTEANGTAPGWFKLTALLVLLAVSGVNAAQFWRTDHRIAATVFVAVTTVVAALGLWRITR